MTVIDQFPARSRRARNLRDDLLDDLRQAAPMPATPLPRIAPPTQIAPPTPRAPRTPRVPATPATSPPVVSGPLVPVRQATVPPAPAGPGTATLELRVTPRQWSWLRCRTAEDGPGLVLSAGPVQISLSGSRR